MKKLLKSSLCLAVVLTMIICSVCAFAEVTTSDITSSHVEFSGEASALAAKAFVFSPTNTDAELILAVYDGGVLVNAKTAVGTNKILKTDAVDATGKVVKAFVWADATKEVISEIATYDEAFNDVLDTLEITFDGEDFETFIGTAFDPATTTYEKDFNTKGAVDAPEVKATIGDNNATVNVETTVVSENEVKASVTVNYGERIATPTDPGITNYTNTVDVYSYPSTRTYDITIKNAYKFSKDPTKIYLDDLSYDTTTPANGGKVRGNSNWGRLGGTTEFNRKYAKDITLGGDPFKEVNVRVEASGSYKQSFVILIKPTDPAKKGSVIGIPRDSEWNWINNVTPTPEVAMVTTLGKTDDTQVRLAYDEQTGTSTYAQKSSSKMIICDYNGTKVLNNVFFDMCENNGRCNGGRAVGDREPITGGPAMWNVPEGYEGCEYIAPEGDSGNNAMGSAGYANFQLFLTADAEVSVWTKTTFTSVTIAGEDVTAAVTTPADHFIYKYQNGLNIVAGKGDGYQEAYEKYADVIEALFIYNGAILDVDYRRTATELKGINYDMPAGWDYNESKFGWLYYLVLKENGQIVDPNTDPRIAGKTPAEIAALMAEVEEGTEGEITPEADLVTNLDWCQSALDLFTAQNYNANKIKELTSDIVKFGVTATNGNYFGIFNDRGNRIGWGQNTGVLVSYPGIFNLKGQTAIRYGLSLFNNNQDDPLAFHWRYSESTPWNKFTVTKDATVMVFSLAYDYAATANGKGQTGWVNIPLSEDDYLMTNNSTFSYKTLAVKNFEAGDTVEILTPGDGNPTTNGYNGYTEYMVVVIPR